MFTRSMFTMLCERLALQRHLFLTPSFDLYTLLLVDVLVGAYMPEERKAYMEYVRPPLMVNPVAVFVKEGHAFPFTIWEDLVGKKGGALLGNSFGEQFDAFAAARLDLNRVNAAQQLFALLERGRVDYVVWGLYAALAEAERLNVASKIELLPTHVSSSDPLYVGFSKQSSCQGEHAYLSQKLQEYIDQGLMDDLIKKYLLLWKKQTGKR